MRATANPKIKQYVDKRTGKPRYLVRYRKPDGRQTTKRGFERKLDAERWLADVEGAKRSGTFVAVSAGRTRVRDLAPAWLDARRAVMKQSSWEALNAAWTLHVEPTFGDRAVSTILPSEVSAWVTGLAGDRSATVVRRAHGVLARILDVAVADRMLVANPARGVELPRARSEEARYLSHMEVRAVADAAGEHRPLVYLLAYGGLRWGEAIGLQGRHIEGNRIRVERSVTPVKGGWQVGLPKTHERRTLYIPGFVADMLPTVEDDDLVFPARRGEFLRSPGYSERGQKMWWQRALEEAGVPYLRIHDLRHTAASLAVQSGASVKAVQRMLGHRSAAVTLDVYSGLFDSDLEDVAARMGAARDHYLTTDEGETRGKRGHLRAVPAWR